MISFGNGTRSSSPFDDSEEPPEGLKNLIKAIFGKPFPEGTSLNSLNSLQVLQVIEEVMYKNLKLYTWMYYNISQHTTMRGALIN